MAVPPEHPVQTGVFPPDSPHILRQALRQQCLAARLALSPAAHAAASRQIEDRLYALLAPRAPASLGFCWPIRGEFDPRPLAARLARLGWALALPAVAVRAAPLVWRAWTPQAALVPDEFGITTAAGADLPPPAVLLVPFVAVDPAGYRLGYGGGYFDRSLAALAPAPETIGVGFALGRVASVHPQPHDIPLDRIVTETATWTRQAAPPAG